jgi:hypothetical protein
MHTAEHASGRLTDRENLSCVGRLEICCEVVCEWCGIECGCCDAQLSPCVVEGVSLSTCCEVEGARHLLYKHKTCTAVAQQRNTVTVNACNKVLTRC